MGYTSFINEHTAELILVPQVIGVLSTKYKIITPIYYWASREGGKVSRASFEGKMVQVVAMYARRPKVSHAGSGKILVKFNDLLFVRNRFLKSKGIPVIAGVPLANRLEFIKLDTPCMWFRLSANGSEVLSEIDLERTERIITDSIESISINQIIEIADKEAKRRSWIDTISIIKEMGSIDLDRYRHRNMISGDFYKPVYFILQT